MEVGGPKFFLRLIGMVVPGPGVICIPLVRKIRWNRKNIRISSFPTIKLVLMCSRVKEYFEPSLRAFRDQISIVDHFYVKSNLKSSLFEAFLNTISILWLIIKNPFFFCESVRWGRALYRGRKHSKIPWDSVCKCTAQLNDV